MWKEKRIKAYEINLLGIFGCAMNSLLDFYCWKVMHHPRIKVFKKKTNESLKFKCIAGQFNIKFTLKIFLWKRFYNYLKLQK